MEANIIAKLEKKKEEEIKAKEAQEIQEATIDGEKTYVNKCQTCHGVNGEKSAYNTSRPLKDLSIEDMNDSIKNYKTGRVDSQNATLMAPYDQGRGAIGQQKGHLDRPVVVLIALAIGQRLFPGLQLTGFEDPVVQPPQLARWLPGSPRHRAG